MRIFLIAALLLCCAPGLVSRAMAEESVFPLKWTTPAGVRSETVALPLKFAPKVQHSGVEELRFTPGFDKPSAPDYFSYAFVWLISDKDKIDGDVIASDMHEYYKGLMDDVASEKQEPLSKYHRTDVMVDNVWGTPVGFANGPRFTAHVWTWDAFFTQRPLKLDVAIYELHCPIKGKRLLYFEASPNSVNETVKREFETLRKAIRI